MISGLHPRVFRGNRSYAPDAIGTLRSQKDTPLADFGVDSVCEGFQVRTQQRPGYAGTSGSNAWRGCSRSHWLLTKRSVRLGMSRIGFVACGPWGGCRELEFIFPRIHPISMERTDEASHRSHAVVIRIEDGSYRLCGHAEIIPEHICANAPITPTPLKKAKEPKRKPVLMTDLARQQNIKAGECDLALTSIAEVRL